VVLRLRTIDKVEKLTEELPAKRDQRLLPISFSTYFSIEIGSGAREIRLISDLKGFYQHFILHHITLYTRSKPDIDKLMEISLIITWFRCKSADLYFQPSQKA
jgi:hypothetical protein